MRTGQHPKTDRLPAISGAEKGAASFTPGPWVANESMVSGRIRNAIFAGKHGNKILATARDPYGEDSEVAEANARLIAAAPAMAEALESVRQELWVDYCLQRGRTDVDEEPFKSRPVIRILDAALSLAKGGPAMTATPLLDAVEALRSKERRHKLPPGECKYCDREREAGSSFHPSHDASDRCESGKHSHCTCDTCF